MKTNSLLNGVAAFIVYGTATFASGQAAPSSADHTFVVKAAQGGMAEVADGIWRCQKAQIAAFMQSRSAW
jgi:hypothetical protein